MGLHREVSRCQNYNKPTFYLCVSVCVYECECVDRSCQGGATGISNKQQIIHVSILWPKHGCQIFVPFSSFWVQEKNLERHAECWSGGSLFFHSFTHDDDNNDQSQFVHILKKAHSENLYEFSARPLWAKGHVNHSTGSSADLMTAVKLIADSGGTRYK